MRGDTHAGCGERSGETGPWQHRHRAPDRLNGVIVGNSGVAALPVAAISFARWAVACD